MLERLNEVMDHIELRLTERIDGAEMARIAVTSEYHLRRMFSALAGMPLSEYIRRRRMTVAGAEVLADRETLLDIAVRYGYGSGEAFARAFRAVHGVGPGEARRTGATLHAQPRMSFRLTVEGSGSMRYRIVEKGEFRVVGRKARVPLIHEGVNPHIAEFVRGIEPEVSERLLELADQEPGGIVAVTDNFQGENGEEDQLLDYYHAVVTDQPPPDDMESLTVPAGTWAVFSSSGEHPSTLQYMWRDVYTQWFPSNPYRGVPGPTLLQADVSDDYGYADCELWIPVEREPEITAVSDAGHGRSGHARSGADAALSSADIEHFVERGFVRLPGAFPRAVGEECRAFLWREMGLDPDDPDAWTEPVVRLGGYADPPFLRAARTDRLHAAFDQLVGAGRWEPLKGLGTFPVRFPHPEPPGDDGWHLDASFAPDDGSGAYVNVRSRGRSLLLLFLLSDVGEEDAPTRIRAGSHRDVRAFLEPAGDGGRDMFELCAEMDAAGRLDAPDRPEALATGRTGDVYLCHPFLVHASQPLRGTTPRFIAQPPLLPAGPLAPLDRDPARSAPTPLERAVLPGTP